MLSAEHAGVLASRLRALGYRDYNAYLRSAHWHRTRQAYRDDPERIQTCHCGSDEHIHLHHKTYENVGREPLDDLVPLCANCHQAVHVLEGRGDLPLDLVGLYDPARAEAYAAELRRRQERRGERVTDHERPYSVEGSREHAEEVRGASLTRERLAAAILTDLRRERKFSTQRRGEHHALFNQFQRALRHATADDLVTLRALWQAVKADAVTTLDAMDVLRSMMTKHHDARRAA